MVNFDKPFDHDSRYGALTTELETRGLTTKKAFSEVWGANRRFVEALERLAEHIEPSLAVLKEVKELNGRYAALGERLLIAETVAHRREDEILFEGMVLALELVDRLDFIETTEPRLRTHLEKTSLLIEARRLLK